MGWGCYETQLRICFIVSCFFAFFSSCDESLMNILKPVKVSFYDGTEIVESGYKITNTIYPYPAPPIKDNYTFTDWVFNDKTIPLTEKTYSLEPSKGEYKYYSSWVMNPMMVSFYDGDKLLLSKEIEEGETYDYPEAPTAEGSTFLGWKLNGNIIPIEDKTFSHEYSPEG